MTIEFYLSNVWIFDPCKFTSMLGAHACTPPKLFCKLIYIVPFIMYRSACFPVFHATHMGYMVDI